MPIAATPCFMRWVMGRSRVRGNVISPFRGIAADAAGDAECGVFLAAAPARHGVKPKVYRVFADRESALFGESALGSFRVRGPVTGRATVERADVDAAHRHRGIAARVYDVIEEDMMLVGAELWPSAPGSMSDDGFRLW